MSTAPDSDVVLVTRSAQGSRPAFAQIVERYQALVCSVAYSATGSITRSEDVAQETFIAAWRGIGALREPERLRAWLCGIARNLAHNTVRAHATEPANEALPIEAIADAPAEDALPGDRAIRDEEQAILWRAIGSIPDAYREPLVMFYREQKSIAHVAAALELSEDAVKQRLTRGRRLLQEEVAAFVEGALARSGPGKAFTLAVIAALPGYGVSTSAAAAVLATKGAKSAGWAALALGLFGPLIGVAGAWLGIRTGLDSAETPRERDMVKRFAFRLIASSVLFSIALIAWIEAAPRFTSDALALASFTLAAGAWGAWFARTAWRDVDSMRDVRKAAGGTWFRESISATRFLGLPLWHIHFGVPEPGAPAARGWIAVGDRAIGGLFALGSFTIAPVSVGMVAAGGISIGAVAIGVVPMGAFAIGALALGGAAIGLVAIGGYAVAWNGAAGGLAVAHHFAGGGHAFAAHANDIAARDWFVANLPSYTFPLMLAVLAVLALVPTAVLAWWQRRILRRS
ncbi:MAG TPA: sigma-70 family RNA polymerase sigma factor [Xanthomonadales bacterium]|nr:sigma-70 family RNA polymerase sigma factor [Xanthomonadales bacterium]